MRAVSRANVIQQSISNSSRRAMAWRSYSVISCDMAVLQSWGSRMMIDIAPKPMIPDGFGSRRREEWVERRCKVGMEAVKHKNDS